MARRRGSSSGGNAGGGGGGGWASRWLRSRKPRAGRRPSFEVLESRALLSSSGYVLSGDQWANPSDITFSFAPDGVFWDHGTNNLNATMNSLFGTGGSWQRELARALQTWASVANVNFTQVPDAGLPFNTSGQAQSDPRFGDIRVGGYHFLDPTTLAQTFFPPPDGTTAAGDTEINTAIGWHIGSDTDLFSVMLHEFGHSLGLDHSLNPTAVMSPVYGGVRAGLTADDIAGIQAIYGARTLDAFQSHNVGTSLANAIDLTSALNGAGQATETGVELATIGDTEYYTVTAPADGETHMQVAAIASGVSLLSPRLNVYNASGALLDTEGQPAAYGDSVSSTTSPVVPGERFYIAVTGATQDVFATGAYHLQVSFLGGPPPPPPLPPVTPPSGGGGGGNPAPVLGPDRFEPNNTVATATNLGVVTQTALVGLSLDTVRDVDVFFMASAGTGTYQVAAPGTNVWVINSRGRLIAAGTNATQFHSTRAGLPFYVVTWAPTPQPVAAYNLAIGFQPLARLRTRGGNHMRPHGESAAQGHVVEQHADSALAHATLQVETSTAVATHESAHHRTARAGR